MHAALRVILSTPSKAGGVTPPEPSVFANGVWDDTAAWNDTHIWKDAP